MTEHRRREHRSETLRELFLRAKRILRLQKVVRNASPAELELFEALAAGTLVTQAGRTTVTIQSREPLLAAAPDSAVPVLATSLDGFENALLELLKSLDKTASVAGGGIQTEQELRFAAQVNALTRTLREIISFDPSLPRTFRASVGSLN